MDITLKLCTFCGESKPRGEFHKAGSGVQGACKPCVVKRVTEWRQNNPGCREREWKMSGYENAKRYRASFTKEQLSEYYKKSDLKKKYGVTLDWYKEKLKEQNGVCAICKNPSPGKHKLAVDHCHKTGKNRGLLCAPCNTALHRMEQEIEWADAARDYLLKHSEKELK